MQLLCVCICVSPARSRASWGGPTGQKLHCRGSFAVVKLAVHKKTGERFAVKQIDKSAVKDSQEALQNEIDILKQARV